MANLIDYLSWRGDLTFSERAFAEPDNLILAMTSYVDFEGIVPEAFSTSGPTLGAAMESYHTKTGGSSYLGYLIHEKTMDIMYAAGKSERFGSMRLCGYVNKIDHDAVLQFSAVTFLLPGGEIYVAFRGTDDTITGWKEDLNLCLETPVPAELLAADYLSKAAAALPGAIRVGGHSKGGHLAIHAAAAAEPELQSRILAVYSNDGPGFFQNFYKTPGYLAIRDRTSTYIPQASIVGTLLEQDSDRCFFIQSGGTGLWQHNAIHWLTDRAGFLRLEQRNKLAAQSDEAMKQWMRRTSIEERKFVLDSIFEVLDSAGVKTLTEFRDTSIRSMYAMVRAMHGMEPETKKMVMQLFRRFFRSEEEKQKR